MKNNHVTCTCLSCMAFKVLQIPFFPSKYSGIDQMNTVANLGIDSDRLQVPARVLSQFIMHHLGNEMERNELLSLAMVAFTTYPLTSTGLISFGNQCDTEASFMTQRGNGFNLAKEHAKHSQNSRQDSATSKVNAGPVQPPVFNGNSRLGADLTEALAGFNPVQASNPKGGRQAEPRDCDECKAAKPAFDQAVKDGSAGKMMLVFPSQQMPLTDVALIVKQVFLEYPELKPEGY